MTTTSDNYSDTAWELIAAAEWEAMRFSLGIAGNSFAAAIGAARSAAAWLDEGPGDTTPEMHTALDRAASMLPEWATI